MTAEPFLNPVVEAGVAGLDRLFTTRAITPTEATEVYLARIERLNPQLRAYCDVDAEGAKAAAARSSARRAAGTPLSPLDGVPIAVKSNIAVAGLPCTAGIGAYRDRIAAEDADCVARLREAGAVILGTLNMEEGALGAVTDNPWFGRTINPWLVGGTPGGSSGGSGAAVAAGLCAAALGTDTMGSVRVPASYCGVFGHKPMAGLISTAGVVPLSWTLDHVGPLARSLEDLALMTNHAAGIGPEALSPASLTELRAAPVAVLASAGQVDVQLQVAEALKTTVERLKRAGVAVEVLRLEYDFGRVRRRGLLISEAEGYVEHREALDGDGFSDGFRAMLKYGGEAQAWRLAEAYRDLADAADALSDQLTPYAAVIAPTTPQTAFRHGEEIPISQADFTAVANVTGLPATAFPVGVSSAGLPLSVQAIAWEDATALGLAEVLADPVGAPPSVRA